MKLQNVSKISHSNCFACRFAGKDIIIWFLEQTDRAQRWSVYINFREDVYVDGTKQRNRHGKIDLCWDHNAYAVEDWQNVILEELAQYEAWHRYITREDRKRPWR